MHFEFNQIHLLKMTEKRTLQIRAWKWRKKTWTISTFKELKGHLFSSLNFEIWDFFEVGVFYVYFVYYSFPILDWLCFGFPDLLYNYFTSKINSLKRHHVFASADLGFSRGGIANFSKRSKDPILKCSASQANKNRQIKSVLCIFWKVLTS